MITKKFIFEMKHRSTEAPKHRSTVDGKASRKLSPCVVKFFLFAALPCQPPANEGKFTRRLGNKISLTQERNFLSEIGENGWKAKI